MEICCNYPIIHQKIQDGNAGDKLFARWMPAGKNDLWNW